MSSRQKLCHTCGIRDFHKLIDNTSQVIYRGENMFGTLAPNNNGQDEPIDEHWDNDLEFVMEENICNIFFLETTAYKRHNVNTIVNNVK